MAIPEAELENLRDRLALTRWPEAETVDDWSQGVPLHYLQQLTSYWREGYDWRAFERRLNDWGLFTSRVDGADIAFLHVRSPHSGAIPLVIPHGWAGSIATSQRIIGPLVDPPAFGGDAEDAFHVVCPSLPGYAFSTRPATQGWGVERLADAVSTIMHRLGYERYGAQAGSFGAILTRRIAVMRPEELLGLHLNRVIVDPSRFEDLDDLTPREQDGIAFHHEYLRAGEAYAAVQRTRPQTVGYGLTDSPTGQCAWVIEKFHDWSSCRDSPEDVFSRDDLLDNIMLYWLGGHATSSARMYWETEGLASVLGFLNETIDVPTGISSFPREIFPISERWVRPLFGDLRFYREHDHGGHFAALERPDALVDDIRAFFATVR